MQHDNSLTGINVHYLAQAVSLLSRVDDERFTRTEAPVFTSSMGAHLRHAFDHYMSFMDGLDEGRIDYEARRRDGKFENERGHARQQFEETMHRLAAIPESDSDRPLVVKTETDEDACDRPVWAQSSVRRELDFLLSHTVHHFALIGMMLRMQGFDPGPDFGIAPSTLRYQQGNVSCAR